MVGSRIDAGGHAADNGEAPAGEIPGKPAGVFIAHAAALATAHDGQRGPGQRVGITPEKKCARSVSHTSQLGRIGWIVQGQQVVAGLFQ